MQKVELAEYVVYHRHCETFEGWLDVTYELFAINDKGKRGALLGRRTFAEQRPTGRDGLVLPKRWDGNVYERIIRGVIRSDGTPVFYEYLTAPPVEMADVIETGLEEHLMALADQLVDKDDPRRDDVPLPWDEVA